MARGARAAPALIHPSRGKITTRSKVYLSIGDLSLKHIISLLISAGVVYFSFKHVT